MEAEALSLTVVEGRALLNHGTKGAMVGPSVVEAMAVAGGSIYCQETKSAVRGVTGKLQVTTEFELTKHYDGLADTKRTCFRQYS